MLKILNKNHISNQSKRYDDDDAAYHATHTPSYRTSDISCGGPCVNGHAFNGNACHAHVPMLIVVNDLLLVAIK